MLINPRIITFLTLAETLNYTHTAERLNLSQPAVTKHIQALEEDFQTKLIKYENKQVNLTDKGKEVIPYLESLVKLNRLTTELFHKQPKKTQIRLGVCLTLGNYFINEVMETFYEAYPKIELIVYIENTKKLEKMLTINEIDLALVLGPTAQSRFNTQTLEEKEMIFIAAENNPLLKKELSIYDLRDQKIYLREKGAGARDVFQLHLAKRGLSLEDFTATETAGSIELIKQLVLKGNGIAPLYELSVANELKNGSLKKLAIKDLEMSYPMTILTSKNTMATGSIKILINHIINFLNQK